MLPQQLITELNKFYAENSRVIDPLESCGFMELEGNSRPLSFMDAFVLVNYARDISPGAMEYIAFISDYLKSARDVELYFRANVKASQDHKDAVARPGGWAGFGTLPLALALYAASRSGVQGNYVECGVFKGGALACVSKACGRLGRRAIAADTFEGLPEADPTGYWQKNQFHGRLEDVQNNIRNAGDPAAVEWRKGLFSDTLPSIADPVSVIFLDTDLYNSSISALEALEKNTSENTILFSDGVTGVRDFSHGVYTPHQGEAKAVGDYYKSRGWDFDAAWTGNGNMSLFKRRSKPTAKLLYSTGFMHYFVVKYLFAPRFADQLNLMSRKDQFAFSEMLDKSLVGSFDAIGSHFLHELIVSKYFIGHLEWKAGNSK